jgi:uncharacterized protein (DUF849 family)
MNDLIINFCPTGIIPTKEMSPFVPLSVNEIIDDVHEAYDLGITMAHLHARDIDLNNTSSPETFSKIISGVRKYCGDLIVCFSTSGRVENSLVSRSRHLELLGELRPDMASLTLGSLNFNKEASINHPDMIKNLALKMSELKIKPELEVFDTGMINYAKYLIKNEVIKPPFYFNLILGNLFSAQTDPHSIGILLSHLPEKSIWAIGGVGNYQLEANSIAIASGGGVRVGLEDNIWFDKNRTRLCTNGDLIKRIHIISSIHERKIMKPSKARIILGLETKSDLP